MKFYAVLVCIAVPFLALSDAMLIFYRRAIEGFGLVHEMWVTE